MNYKVAVLGARGYVGQELINIISKHPHLELMVASSRELEGQHIQGYEKDQLQYQLIDIDQAGELSADLVFLALPNGLSKDFVEAIIANNPNIIIIDLSADHRFDNDWEYSLPEVHPLSQANYLSDKGQSLKSSAKKRIQLISNPGCYATAIQLSLAPLKRFIEGKVSCFGVSGYSGAGTKPSDKNNIDKLKDNLMPYQLTEHVHEKEVSRHLGLDIKFSPHVAEFFRGIDVTSHVNLNTDLNLSEIKKLFKEFYDKHELVMIQGEPPFVKSVAGTHQTLIGGFSLSEDGKHLAINCVIDNLLKGAATQAIQNANWALNLPLMTGITDEEINHG